MDEDDPSPLTPAVEASPLDEEDPIVDEYEVFLNRLEESGDASAVMYLLQYPLRPIYRPYGDHGQLTKVEKGDVTNKLRLKYTLNVEGEEYDEAKKRLRLDLLTRKELGKLDEEEEILLETLSFQKLVSTEAMNQGRCQYGLAFRKEKQIFITPVSKILQFRPDFSHQDELDEIKARRGTDLKDRLSSSRNTDASTYGDEDKEVTTANESAEGSSKGGGDSSGGRKVEGAGSPGKPKPSSAPLDMSAVNSRIRLSHAEARKKELGEQYSPVETFFDSDSPEGLELINLLSSYPIKYRVEVAADHQLDDLLFDGRSDREERRPGFEIRTKRSSHSDKIPNILLDSTLSKYLNALCAGCALSTLAGTNLSTDRDGGLAVAGGVGTGLLSYLALSKLSLEQRLKRVLKVREIETFENIREVVDPQGMMAEAKLISILLNFGVVIHGNWIVSSDCLWEEQDSLGAGAMKTDFVRSKWTDTEKLTRDLVLCFYATGVDLAKPTIMKYTGCPADRLNRMVKTIYKIEDGKYKPRLPADETFKNSHRELCAEQEKVFGKDKVLEIKTRCELLMKQQATFKSSKSPGDKSALDDLDTQAIKTCIEKILVKNGAMSEEFILRQLKVEMSEVIDVEYKSTIAAAMNMGASTSQLLDDHNRVKIALEQLDADQLRDLLSKSAQNFNNLWILINKDRNLDKYRKVLLDMYRQDADKGITKDQFIAECRRILGSFDLTDKDSRTVLNEVSVNMNKRGIWFYKASEEVQKAFDNLAETNPP